MDDEDWKREAQRINNELAAEIERLRALVKALIHHAETEGDDTLVTVARAALKGEWQ